MPEQKSFVVNHRCAKVAVLGSINMDLVLQSQRMPRPGETLFADSANEVCGGKGANQAIAAARAGAQVSMIGRVGDDTFAQRLIGNLRDANVDTKFVQMTEQTASGLAVIVVDASGQNTIMVVPGANASVTINDVEEAHQVIEESDLLLVQLEIPYESVQRGIEIARAANVRVVLDPAPAPEFVADEMLQVDLICPNESEAERLSGLAIGSRIEAEIAARRLVDRGARRVAITLGENGIVYCDGDATVHFPAHAVDCLDSTAAGDALAGAFAAMWPLVDNVEESLRFANAAAALAVSIRGAQPSLPQRTDIDDFLRRASSEVSRG